MKINELSILKDYSAALDNLAKNKSTDTFPNKDHRHASIAIAKILKYSKESFVLFDDDLKGDIVNHDKIESFRDAVIEFISREGKLKIVISDKKDDDDFKLKLFLEVLVDLFPNQVELKLASVGFKNSMKLIYNEKVNFAVGDNNKYRLELFGNCSTNEKTRTAKGSFNDKKISDKLLTAFNDNYSSCQNYF